MDYFLLWWTGGDDICCTETGSHDEERNVWITGLDGRAWEVEKRLKQGPGRYQFGEDSRSKHEMLASYVVRPDIETVLRSCHSPNRLTTVNGVIDQYSVRIAPKIFRDLSSARSRVRGQLFSCRLAVMLSKGISGQRQHSSIAQSSNVPTCLDRVVDPLPTWRSCVANHDVRNRFAWLVCPDDIGCLLEVSGVSIGPDECIKKDVDRKGLCRV